MAHIDRGSALLRYTVHRISTQCTDECVVVELNQAPSEAVPAGSALLMVSGSPPYNVVYWRTPPVLQSTWAAAE